MSIHVENSVWINRPVEEVFAYMTDPSNMPSFVPGITEAEKVTQGPNGVGTQIACKFSMLGGSMDILAEWTRFENNTCYASQNLKGGDTKALTTFQEENGGTRIDRVMDVGVEGFLATLAKPLIRRTAVRNADTEFAQLKDLLEH